MIHPYLFYVLCSTVVSGEYRITSEYIPSYLEIKIKRIGEEIFPNNLKINMSLTKLAGTLLHSLDSLGNQFIIRFSGGKHQSLLVRLNRKEDRIFLSELCGCLPCVSVPMLIHVRIDSEINLQCNGLKNVIANFDLRQDVSVSHSETERNKVNATLWLVNNPRFGNIYFDSEQLEGVIYSAKYYDIPLSFDIYGRSVINTDSKACNPNACHGGICQETYSDEPICDCTNVFGSGHLCINESQTINQIYRHSFTFSKLKISWNSDVKNIIKIGNERTNLEVKVENGSLFAKLQLLNGHISDKDILMPKYHKNKSYVLIISFENGLALELINASKIERPTSVALWKEVFSYFLISSGHGIIDVAYKSKISDRNWKKWKLHEILSEPITKEMATTNHATISKRTITTSSATKTSAIFSSFSISPNVQSNNLVQTSTIVAIIVTASTLIILLIIIFIVIVWLVLKRKSSDQNVYLETNNDQNKHVTESDRYDVIGRSYISSTSLNSNAADHLEIDGYDVMTRPYIEIAQV